MKSTTIRCCCGASIEFRDDAESEINPQHGTPDSKGRRYCIEVWSDDWQDRHRACLEAKARSMEPKASQKPKGGKR